MGTSVEVINTDVLILGGGMAAARACIEAYEHNAHVIMATKARFGQGGASALPNWIGALNVPLGDADPEDSPEEMFNDTIKAGQGVCDENLARILSYEITDRLKDLERWGLNTAVKSNGKYFQVRACFSSRPRAIITNGLQMAPTIMLILKRQIEKRGIQLFEEVMIVSLLVQTGRCVGALGVDKHGKFVVFRAKSTVLATGGGAAIFPCPLYPIDATGDGDALGFRAGAELFNMEFIQMVITGGGINGEALVNLLLNPDVYNGLGERFLPKYLPKGVSQKDCFIKRVTHAPFSTNDIGKYFDIAIYKEILEGRGTKNKGIYLDFTKLSKDDVKKCIDETRGYMYGGVEFVLNRLLETGAKIFEEPQELIPFSHSFSGGLGINEKAETSLPGLYAAGETSAGPHGADRLGGNMLANCLVLGARAGKFAAEKANNYGEVKINERHLDEEIARISKILVSRGETKPKEIKQKINDVMWRSCGFVRNQKDLESCIEELRRLRAEELPNLCIEGGQDLFLALSIPNMLDVGEMVAYAASQRKESRGNHFREDYPNKDDQNWMRTIIISRENFQL